MHTVESVTKDVQRVLDIMKATMDRILLEVHVASVEITDHPDFVPNDHIGVGVTFTFPEEDLREDGSLYYGDEYLPAVIFRVALEALYPEMFFDDSDGYTTELENGDLFLGGIIPLIQE